MAEKRQESCTSDGAVKITWQKGYRLEIENVLLKGLIKLQFWGPATLLKKTPTQVLSCENCDIFTNNYFEEDL